MQRKQQTHVDVRCSDALLLLLLLLLLLPRNGTDANSRRCVMTLAVDDDDDDDSIEEKVDDDRSEDDGDDATSVEKPRYLCAVLCCNMRDDKCRTPAHSDCRKKFQSSDTNDNSSTCDCVTFENNAIHNRGQKKNTPTTERKKEESVSPANIILCAVCVLSCTHTYTFTQKVTMSRFIPAFPRVFASGEAHRSYLRSIAKLPEGFRVGVTSLEFKSPTSGKPMHMRLTGVMAERPTSSFAAVLTRNRIAGAPIILARRRLNEAALLNGVVINNRIANVVAPGGVSAAERVCEAAARAFGLYSGDGIISLSTGVVGWALPVDEMVTAMPALALTSQGGKLDAFDAAESIMTTDQWPKLRAAMLPGGASVVGIAKGAGMVEPNMATMLSMIVTDARVSRSALQRALNEAVNAPGSFNSCTVDSDTSTSDAVIAMASNLRGPENETSAEATRVARQGIVADDNYDALVVAMTEICQGLAEDVVRNGEGVQHVMRVRVSGAPTTRIAHAVGKSIANSPLIKCAVAADDANVGRIAMAIGKAAMNNDYDLSMHRVRVAMGGTVVLEGGSLRASPDVDARITAHMVEARLSFEAPPVEICCCRL